MGSSVLTALLFALSAIFGGRSARIFGSANANLGRVIVALAMLSLWAFTFGRGLHGAGLGWFFVSGCVGFGFGDIALFGALPRIGPRLAVLLTQCLAGPIAGIVEWGWLGQRIGGWDVFLAGVILLGVGTALFPGKDVVDRRRFWAGVICGVISALGQGLGAVISRKASFINLVSGTRIDGGTAAFQRMLGGFGVTVLFWLIFAAGRRKAAGDGSSGNVPFPPKGWHYIVINGLVGPSIGVGFYQYALSTTPSAIVLAIVATSPVMVMLLQAFLGEERPGWVSIGGALAAVGGAIALAVRVR